MASQVLISPFRHQTSTAIFSPLQGKVDANSVTIVITVADKLVLIPSQVRSFLFASNPTTKKESRIALSPKALSSVQNKAAGMSLHSGGNQLFPTSSDTKFYSFILMGRTPIQ